MSPAVARLACSSSLLSRPARSWSTPVALARLRAPSLARLSVRNVGRRYAGDRRLFASVSPGVKGRDRASIRSRSTGRRPSGSRRCAPHSAAGRRSGRPS